jgi:hypothetical protein
LYRYTKEGIAELAKIVAATVNDDDEDGIYEDDDGIYEDEEFEELEEDELVAPLRVPSLEDGKQVTRKVSLKKVNRPKSARAARLSTLTEGELLPPRPNSARAASEAAAAIAAAVASKRRSAAAAAIGGAVQVKSS